MIASDKPNPFSILALPTDATRAEIVARSDELIETAETKDLAMLFRWAKEQLLTNPQVRLEYEFFELPDTEYEDLTWDNFVRVYRKKPLVALKDTAAPGVEIINMPALLQLFLEAMLEPAEANLMRAIDNSPFIPTCKFPLEVRDVIFG